jgi:hypothetical protein
MHHDSPGSMSLFLSTLPESDVLDSSTPDTLWQSLISYSKFILFHRSSQVYTTLFYLEIWKRLAELTLPLSFWGRWHPGGSSCSPEAVCILGIILVREEGTNDTTESCNLSLVYANPVSLDIEVDAQVLAVPLGRPSGFYHSL